MFSIHRKLFFSFEKGSNHQNDSSSCSLYQVKNLPTQWNSQIPPPLTAIWKILLQIDLKHQMLGDTIGTDEGSNESVIARISKGKFNDLVPLLVSWCLPLRAETHILYECAVFVIWKLASYEDVIRLERNDAMVFRYTWHLRPENMIFYEKLNNNRPKLNSTKKCLQNRRLSWFGQLKRRQDCLSWW